MRRDRTDKRKQWILGIFISLIMVTSVFSILVGGFNQGSGSTRYNGYKFSLSQVGYYTKFNGKRLDVDVLPQIVEGVPLDPAIVKIIMDSPQVFVSYDHNVTSAQMMAAAQYGLADTLGKHFGKFVSTAFTSENPYSRPVITCANATASTPVIVLQEAYTTGIRLEGTCIILEATSQEEFVALKDRVVYGVTGIIK